MLPDSDAAICHDHVNRTVCHVRIRLCADNRTDAAGDVVVAGRDVGRERAERLEWGAHAPSRALVSAPADHTSVTNTDRRGRQSEHARRVCCPVFLDHVHGHLARWPVRLAPFDHHLHAFGSRAPGQFALHFEFAEYA